jgi:hypothetical protein
MTVIDAYYKTRLGMTRTTIPAKVTTARTAISIGAPALVTSTPGDAI